MKTSKLFLLLFLFISLSGINRLSSQFVHPGLLHTQADLDRMKDRVAQGAQPWIEGWNALIQDPLAQSTFTASPIANMGSNRQGASRDAHAAYLNAIRWYVTGTNSYADCAIRILNDWSSTVNQVPSGGEFVGLGGIAIAEFAMAAEVMRISSRWQTSDFNRFKNMMVNYLYPVCHDFLTNHNGRCIQYYWANWDANNIMALMAIGVLCDNQAIFNEGVDYYQNGGGTGSIRNAVPFVHAGGLGQWQEMGRDQTHGFLGVGFLATACQIAWNQGIDLFAYDNNRLLAGAEYVAKYNLGDDVPFSTYDNCQDLNHDWPAINGRGRFHDRPVYEMVYNHYVVRRGLSAPFTQKMAEIMRPEGGSRDHFGYGTLTFTLNPSSLPVHPAPQAPANITATAGTGRVFVEWEPSSDYTMRGYNLQRATASGGPYVTIASSDMYTYTRYTDTDVTNGTTYYYRVAGFNRAGTGSYSAVSNSARPLATGGLPSGWSKAEIGSHNAGSASYANVSGGTFVVNGYGTGVGGTADNVTFVYQQATGDNTITGRISSMSGTVSKIGLMIRENLNANAKTVAMTLGEGGWRFARMGYRTSAGANMGSTLGNTYTWQPAWFRITKSGNTFTAYESSNGTTWFQVGSANISMANSYYVGLVVTSGNATSQNTSIFDNVSVSSGICDPTPITPYLQVDGGSWQQTSTATVDAGSSVKFGPQPNDGTWSWSTGATTREITINNIQSSATYVATLTNSCGEQSTQDFVITVNQSDLLIAHYTFDNSTNDASGNGNNATPNGGPTYSTGIVNNAINLDGSNDYVSMPSGILSSVNDMTIATWVNLDAAPTWSRIFDFGTGTSVNMFLTPNSGSGTLRFAITTSGGSGEQQINASSALPTGSWVHVAVTLSGNTGRLYVDGAVAGTNNSLNLDPSDMGNTGNNYIGRSQYPDPYLDGRIDDFRIYNYALSDPEIGNLANVGTGNEPIAWYLFNESSGSTASDASGNGNTAALNGGATFVTGQSSTNAVDLNGSDGYVSMPSGILSSVNDLTIATWVYLNAASTWSRVFDFGTGITTNMFLTPNSGPGTVRFAITTSGGSGEQQINGTSSLPTGSWTHVAITLSGNTGTLYVNGSVVGSNGNLSLNPSDMGSTGNNYIGRSQYPDPYLDGRLDDFRIYDMALGQSEISVLVNGGAKYAQLDDNFAGNNSHAVLIYPNPTTDILKIKLLSEELTEGANLYIYDNTGRLLKSVVIAGDDCQVDISDLKYGIYVVKISNDRQSINKQVIIR